MEKALENAQRLSRNLAEVGALGIEEPVSLDVNDLVRSAVRGMPVGEIELSLAPAIAATAARANDLARALGALLQNARDASAGSGPIRVSTGQDADGIRVQVDDLGEGIPDVIRRRDFDPLYSTSGQRGRGLGITIARLAAWIAGGRLEIESRPEGGTRAVLVLRPAQR
ncbi:MAG TPA: ATP-binding protein [Thermoanaerobaculia bacterium]|nr:ATP-binding protein [Thermoanaerobaculia bacterium]